MNFPLEITPALGLAAVLLVVLGLATGIAQWVKIRAEVVNPAVLRTFMLRLRAWWLMMSVVTATFLLPDWATVILFGFVSFWALREFITLTPTRIADHRALFWVFFFFTPLQYLLVALRRDALYEVVLPVYAVLFVPARIAMAGDYRRFLERTAKIQCGLMVCVYCLSYAPALLNLRLASPQQNRELFFFFLLVVQLGDVMEYVWDKFLGRRVIAPAISRTKTWEGFLGGAASTTLLGAALWWATPFSQPWQAGGMSLLAVVMGYAGGLTMSAIKRDRGVRDYGTLIEGHGGILDRLDSTCFAAPVVYHVTEAFFQSPLAS